MVVRHTPVISELRLFESDAPGHMAPFDACCSVVWETPTVAWVRMLHGRLTLRMAQQLLDFFVERGVKTLRATRADGRILPGGKARDDGTFEIDVQALAARRARKR